MVPRRDIRHVTADQLFRRVCFHLVRLDQIRNPSRYRPYPPSGVLQLAEQFRAQGYPNVYWYLLALCKAMPCGFTVTSWRDEANYAGILRAMHKQVPRRRRPV